MTAEVIRVLMIFKYMSQVTSVQVFSWVKKIQAKPLQTVVLESLEDTKEFEMIRKRRNKTLQWQNINRNNTESPTQSSSNVDTVEAPICQDNVWCTEKHAGTVDR